MAVLRRIETRALWLFAVAAWLLLASGCGRLCETSCAEDGLCSVRTYRAGDALYRCYAGSDAECADSAACRDDGRCFATEQGTCVVAEQVADEACATSMYCTRWGQCGHRDGVCWAESDADCEASFECRTIGRCGARGGVCIPLSDGDCARSLGCEVEGLCERFSYLRLGYECRVPLDDATACEQSWVCEHYGRCTPAVPANCEGCRYGFCAEPGQPGRLSCSAAAAVTPACSTDGRCAPDATYACAHAPVGGPGVPGPVQNPAKPDVGPGVKPDSSRSPAPPDLAQDNDAGTPVWPPPPPPPPTAEPNPFGPGSVAYTLDDLGGRSYEGVHTWASVLTGVIGFESDPVDFLVLRATPEEGCSPRSSSAFLPLGAFWLIGALPAGEGTFEFEGGPMPGQMSAKTWVWTGERDSGSYNVALHGSVRVTSRTATEIRGSVDFRVTAYFSDTSMGTIRGDFVANVVDCSAHTGGWPM